MQIQLRRSTVAPIFALIAFNQVAASAPDSDRCIDVVTTTIEEVNRTPGRFDGRLISVTGFARLQGEPNEIWQSKECESASQQGCDLLVIGLSDWNDLWFWDRPPEGGTNWRKNPLDQSWIEIVGLFMADFCGGGAVCTYTTSAHVIDVIEVRVVSARREQ